MSEKTITRENAFIHTQEEKNKTLETIENLFDNISTSMSELLDECKNLENFTSYEQMNYLVDFLNEAVDNISDARGSVPETFSV